MNRPFITLMVDAGLVAGLATVLCAVGPTLDHGPTYASYGYTAEPVEDAAARGRRADQDACAALHGPHSVAIELPDGQHRCADKHGRRFNRTSATTLSKEQP